MVLVLNRIMVNLIQIMVLLVLSKTLVILMVLDLVQTKTLENLTQIMVPALNMALVLAMTLILVQMDLILTMVKLDILSVELIATQLIPIRVIVQDLIHKNVAENNLWKPDLVVVVVTNVFGVNGVIIPNVLQLVVEV